jgi:hypothetical protein
VGACIRGPTKHLNLPRMFGSKHAPQSDWLQFIYTNKTIIKEQNIGKRLLTIVTLKHLV